MLGMDAGDLRAGAAAGSSGGRSSCAAASAESNMRSPASLSRKLDMTNEESINIPDVNSADPWRSSSLIIKSKSGGRSANRSKDTEEPFGAVVVVVVVVVVASSSSGPPEGTVADVAM